MTFLARQRRRFAKGDLLGWFNMGSTVILLLPAGAANGDDDMTPGESLRMGEAIGSTVSRISIDVALATIVGPTPPRRAAMLPANAATTSIEQRCARGRYAGA